MPVFPASDENLRAAAALLASGGLVIFPTETVYGLGGDAFNPSALARIFEVKNRPRFDPLIIHICSPETLEAAADFSLLTGEARRKLEVLSGRLWPGPLTLILPKKRRVPDLATSGLPTAAFRFPDHPVAQKLLRLSGTALAAPSANLFGRLSPTRAEHALEQLGDRVGMILDGGPARVGVESTVLDLTGERPRILRPGGTPRELIEALIGGVERGPALSDEAGPGLRAPGQLPGHYAPRTPLALRSREELVSQSPDPAGAYLFFDPSSRDQWLAGPGRGAGNRTRILSETGDLTEAAANLFELLHEMDGLGASRIYAEQVREEGLGPAINDRLSRAAGGNGKTKPSANYTNYHEL
jgi:L-threonylcarbamoyladenylate synthase